MKRSNYFFDNDGNRFEYGECAHAPEFMNKSKLGKQWTNTNKETLKSSVEKNTSSEGTINWDQVSLDVGDVSPMECFIQFRNVHEPSINHNDWTSEEEKKLISLVEKYSEHHWCEISTELGSKRTPFQCLQHYQQALNNNLVVDNNWSEEEDKILAEAVDIYGINSWQHVAGLLEGRSANQCQQRWRKSSVCQKKLVSGYWLPDEERLLLLAAVSHKVPFLSATKRDLGELERVSGSGEGIPGVEKKNKNRVDWSTICKYIPGKNSDQCRDKWCTSLDPSLSYEPFTPEEDQLLERVISLVGERKWSKVAQFLPFRSDSSVRKRWTILKKDAENSNKTKNLKRKPLPKLYARSKKSKLEISDFTPVLQAKIKK